MAQTVSLRRVPVKPTNMQESLPPYVEQWLLDESKIEFKCKEMMALATELGLVETESMRQLRAQIKNENAETQTELFTQYVIASEEQIEHFTDKYNRPRAQLAGLLLQAVIFLENEMYGEYFEVASLARNLALPELCDPETIARVDSLEIFNLSEGFDFLTE